MATLLYEQFIHFTTQHSAFEHLAACLTVFSELLPGLIVTCWVNFRENYLHEHELQLSDYNI